MWADGCCAGGCGAAGCVSPQGLPAPARASARARTRRCQRQRRRRMSAYAHRVLLSCEPQRPGHGEHRRRELVRGSVADLLSRRVTLLGSGKAERRERRHVCPSFRAVRETNEVALGGQAKVAQHSACERRRATAAVGRSADGAQRRRSDVIPAHARRGGGEASPSCHARVCVRGSECTKARAGGHARVSDARVCVCSRRAHTSAWHAPAPPITECRAPARSASASPRAIWRVTEGDGTRASNEHEPRESAPGARRKCRDGIVMNGHVHAVLLHARSGAHG